MTYAGATDPLTRVIVAEGYPEVTLTAERLMLLKGVVSNEIDGIREGPMPRFRGTNLKAGVVVVRCADEVSLRWLENRIGDVSPWEGAKLKVVNLEVLRKQYRAVLWFLGSPEDAATGWSGKTLASALRAGECLPRRWVQPMMRTT